MNSKENPDAKFMRHEVCKKSIIFFFLFLPVNISYNSFRIRVLMWEYKVGGGTEQWRREKKRK